MACKIAENEPLQRLRRELGLPAQCHSLRPSCLEGHAPREGEFALGIPGAALGYCQALFNCIGSPSENTERLVSLLREIDAPWAHSHELFWGYRGENEGPADYVNDAIAPLRAVGRVPILITGLNPAHESALIDTILETTPALHDGETMLLRIVLDSDGSVEAAADLVKRLHRQAHASHNMPKWWPLLQGALSAKQWLQLKHSLGSLWSLQNIAVNPWTPASVYDAIRDQVTVGQVPVGLAGGVSQDGRIQLAAGMVQLTDAQPAPHYYMSEYMSRLAELDSAPTLIVLGPSLPHWTDEQNQERIASLIPVLREGCDRLWDGVGAKRRESVWNLVA